MADTTFKPESSIPKPPAPSTHPQDATMSSSEGTATKAPSTPPKVPAGRGNAEGGASRSKSESAGTDGKSASPGNGERPRADSANAPDQSERTESPAGGGMVTLAGAGLKKTRERIEDQIYTQRDRITGGVRTLSRALRGAGGMLDEDDMVARGLHYASEKVETVAGYVDELTPQRLATDLRGVSHREPAWFFGGAFILGLALGRFARSTSAHATSVGSTASPS